MLEFSLISIFLVGLLGGGHCVGMCGGIVTAVSVSLPQRSAQQSPQWHYVLAYNAGRILSYSLAGALAGAVGASSFFLAHVLPIEKILYGLASLMLILLGLYLAGYSAAVSRVEVLGQRLWRHIQPYSKRFIPLQTVAQAFGLGTLWGWLPCGLVYSVLIAALASGSPLRGAAIMLSFGLGTLPTLLLMGMAAVRFKQYLQQPWLRRASGYVVMLFGVTGLWHLLFAA